MTPSFTNHTVKMKNKNKSAREARGRTKQITRDYDVDPASNPSLILTTIKTASKSVQSL